MRSIVVSVVFVAVALSSGQGRANTSGKILVVLSSENKITLKDGVQHPTGFFLPELMGPVKLLLDHGYQLVYANPKGTRAVMDKVSDSAFWFGDVPGASVTAQAKARFVYRDVRSLCERLRLCGAPGSLEGDLELYDLDSIVRKGLEEYDAVFLPGGHAPMEDLWKDKNVKKVLRYFHQARKPTALICHAPVSLLAALDDPEGYIRVSINDDRKAIVNESKSWIYKGYAMTVFTTREEQQEETGGEDGVLGGFVKFYADEALEKAGAYVVRADKWKSNVVVSHELVTGQNPFSHDALGAALLKMLEKQKEN